MKLKKSLGQNFLKNEIISHKIIENILKCKSKNILEIGCGDGALTKILNELKWKKFIIVEFDEFWAENAKEKFKNAKTLYGNILNFELPEEEKDWIVIGNIPYNITYGILQKIILWRNKTEKIVLMIQEEVAQKLYKKKGKDYGPISILIQLFFKIELLEKVLPENFFPKPKVISRIISLVPKFNILIQNYSEFCTFLSIIFKNPRKMIRNNILNSIYENKLSEDILSKRGQELSCDEILKIWNLI